MIPVIQMSGFRKNHMPFILNMNLKSSVCIFVYLVGNDTFLNNIINSKYYNQIKAKNKKCKFIYVGIAKNNKFEKKNEIIKVKKKLKDITYEDIFVIFYQNSKDIINVLNVATEILLYNDDNDDGCCKCPII